MKRIYAPLFFGGGVLNPASIPDLAQWLIGYDGEFIVDKISPLVVDPEPTLAGTNTTVFNGLTTVFNPSAVTLPQGGWEISFWLSTPDILSTTRPIRYSGTASLIQIDCLAGANDVQIYIRDDTGGLRGPYKWIPTDRTEFNKYSIIKDGPNAQLFINDVPFGGLIDLSSVIDITLTGGFIGKQTTGTPFAGSMGMLKVGDSLQPLQEGGGDSVFDVLDGAEHTITDPAWGTENYPSYNHGGGFTMFSKVAIFLATITSPYIMTVTPILTDIPA